MCFDSFKLFCYFLTILRHTYTHAQTLTHVYTQRYYDTIGTEEFKEQYVKDKVEKWVKDVKQLADIAKEDPQAALSASKTGLSQVWKFIQRTVPKIAHLFEPLENAISTDLIPALCGRSISDIERKIFALLYRYGGMGILNPVETSEREYATSVDITDGLTELIFRQEMNLGLLDREGMSNRKKELKKEKEAILKQDQESIASRLDEKSKRMLEAASEKGASSWLSALPLKQLGYTFNTCNLS